MIFHVPPSPMYTILQTKLSALKTAGAATNHLSSRNYFCSRQFRMKIKVSSPIINETKNLSQQNRTGILIWRAIDSELICALLVPVGIVTGYSLDTPRIGVGFSDGLLYGLQTGSGAHPVSCSLGTMWYFHWVKRPGHEADHSPASSGAAKNAWGYTSTVAYIFTLWWWIKLKRNNEVPLRPNLYRLCRRIYWNFGEGR
jgi:hypothetical protein